MKLRTAHRIESTMWYFMHVLIILVIPTEGIISTVFGVLSFVIMLAAVTFAHHFRRCPHCGIFLRMYGDSCSPCGKELDWRNGAGDTAGAF